MKPLKIFALVVALNTGAWIIPQEASAQQVAVSIQLFYDSLLPYGTWVSYSSYGYVWVPDVPVGFRPYFSNGRWVYTDSGWMWVSYYDWGWAPFHYGSWIYDPLYGWMWVPGFDWSPAWVTWGYYSGYYGWAPLGPGISFSISYYPPIEYWVFVPPSYITVSGWSDHYYVASNSRIVFDNNTSITGVRSIGIVDNTGNYKGKRFSAGPTKTEFEKAANKKLEVISVKDDAKPGKADLRGNEVAVYRPKVNDADKRTAKPSKSVPLEKLKRIDRGKASEADKVKGKEGERKIAPEQKPRGRETDKKAPPERKPKIREKQQENKQPQMIERRPEMKQQPKEQGRKSEMKQRPKEQENNTQIQKKKNPQVRKEPEKKSPVESRSPQRKEKR